MKPGRPFPNVYVRMSLLVSDICVGGRIRGTDF